MSERNSFRVDIEQIKKKLESYRLKAKLAVNDVVDENSFRKYVTKEQRELASVQAEAFAGEAMDFFKENLTAKLKPISPNKAQIKLFRFLHESIEDNSLLLEKTRGRVWKGGKKERPYLSKIYRAKDNIDWAGKLTGTLEDIFFNLRQKKDVTLQILWGINDDFLHKITVRGFMGMEFPSMDFLTFPEKIETIEKAQEYLQRPEIVSGFKTKIEVYGKGNRIVMDTEGKHKGNDVAMTEQYFLIGSFEGKGTERTYWLYGSNGNRSNKSTVKESATVKNLASETT